MKFSVIAILFLSALFGAASDVSTKTGQITYEKHCIACHGKNGAGKTAAAQRMPIPDLRAHSIVAMSDPGLAESIGRGIQHKSYPHSYLLRKAITESELQALIGYIRTLQNE